MNNRIDVHNSCSTFRPVRIVIKAQLEGKVDVVRSRAVKSFYGVLFYIFFDRNRWKGNNGALDGGEWNPPHILP